MDSSAQNGSEYPNGNASASVRGLKQIEIIVEIYLLTQARASTALTRRDEQNRSDPDNMSSRK